MQDLMSMLTSLKRPNLLVKAAQLGLPDYRRKTHLPRILQSPAPAQMVLLPCGCWNLSNISTSCAAHGMPAIARGAMLMF